MNLADRFVGLQFWAGPEDLALPRSRMTIQRVWPGEWSELPASRLTLPLPQSDYQLLCYTVCSCEPETEWRQPSGALDLFGFVYVIHYFGFLMALLEGRSTAEMASMSIRDGPPYQWDATDKWDAPGVVLDCWEWGVWTTEELRSGPELRCLAPGRRVLVTRGCGWTHAGTNAFKGSKPNKRSRHSFRRTGPRVRRVPAMVLGGPIQITWVTKCE